MRLSRRSLLAAAAATAASPRVRAAALPLAPPAAAPARLPEHPRVIDLRSMGRVPGRRGGSLRLLMGGDRDVRMMVVYGYARLVVYDSMRSLEFVPDILERFEVEAGRRFTFGLRKGMRWSDGHPFTTEDFRYFWEDIATDKNLSPFGPDPALLAGGEPPRFEVLDPLTVRYTWAHPNPGFLTALAGPMPLEVYAPAHYLEQFHAGYAEPEALQARVEAAGVRNWAALHNHMDTYYKNSNPDRPTLQPWVNTTPVPAQRFVFVRNPFFHRVDERGQQLPYIERVYMDIADAKLIPAKTGAGESDLQARYLHFSDYAFLKQASKRNHYRETLWTTVRGADLALYPNLNVNDPVWQRLVRDVRFRRALSLAIDRHEVNQVLFYGLAREGNNVVTPQSPLYRPWYRTRWAGYEPAQADALLDALGLKGRDGQGIRRLPDGRPMRIIVELSGEDSVQTDALELIQDNWRQIGIELFVKPMQREVFRNRIFSGEALMSMWTGLENGLATPDWSPAELAPTSQQQLQWPMWGEYYESEGKVGEPASLPSVLALERLYRRWRGAATREERTEIWGKMLAIWVDEQFTLGIVGGVPQPLVVNDSLRNVPAKGIYNWDPGAYFGIYLPDTFWLAR